MRTVILINGQMRSGKDYTAKLIKEKLGNDNTKILSFAAPIKEMIATLFDISLEKLDDYKNNKTPLYLENTNMDKFNYQKVTDFRTVLQRFGTQVCKPQFGDSVWADLVLSKICNDEYKDYIIVPDFRFNIESDVIKSSSYRVITLKIENKDLPTADLHSSERELENYDFDYVIDNTGYSKYLDSYVDEFIEKLSIKIV